MTDVYSAPDEDEDVLEVPQDGLGETLFEDDDILEVQPQFDHELFALPEVWRDGDGIDQDVITQRIRKKAAPEMEDLAAYEAMEVKPLKLSRLRQIYESKDERAALDLLKGKWQVQINKEFIVKRKSPEHQWASVSVRPRHVERPVVARLTLSPTSRSTSTTGLFWVIVSAFTRPCRTRRSRKW